MKEKRVDTWTALSQPYPIIRLPDWADWEWKTAHKIKNDIVTYNFYTAGGWEEDLCKLMGLIALPPLSHKRTNAHWSLPTLLLQKHAHCATFTTFGPMYWQINLERSLMIMLTSYASGYWRPLRWKQAKIHQLGWYILHQWYLQTLCSLNRVLSLLLCSRWKPLHPTRHFTEPRSHQTLHFRNGSKHWPPHYITV